MRTRETSTSANAPPAIAAHSTAESRTLHCAFRDPSSCQLARAYSQDLRDRVIDAALGGMPARRVAAQFEIGVATAIVWVRRARASGERTARHQGQPRRSKLDPQRDFLLGLVEQTQDMTIVEMQQQLATERGIKASVGAIWTFLDRCA